MELGKHPAKPVGAQFGVADTGTEQMAIEFRFTDGPNKGNNITAYLYFSEKALERSIESLRICGHKGTDITDLSAFSDPNAPTVQLVLEDEEHNGVKRTKVKWINRLGGPAVKTPMDDARRADFKERMRAHLAAADKVAGKAAAPKADTSGPGKDGLPF